MAGGKSARMAPRQQKSHSKQTNLKQPEAQQDGNQYQVPYQQAPGCSLPPSSITTGPYASTQVPYFYKQPQFGASGGAHTISRASNLHKQFAGDNLPASVMKSNGAGQAASLVYYDQPYLGYASGPTMMGFTPVLGGGGTCPGTAMSLAVREPKGRGPIPFVNGGGTIGPALMRQYAAEQRYQQQQQRHSKQLIYQEVPTSLFSPLELSARFNKPLCRCRVMYLGSSVPHLTKNGLHGIQEPLKHLYPEEKFSSNSLRKRVAQRPAQNMTIDISHLSASLGIDSWLSVWSNGLLLENVDEFGRDIKRFFSIESLHYCAAVRYFDTSTLSSNQTKRDDGERVGHENSDNNNNNNNNNSNQGQDSLNSSGIEQDQENRRPDEFPVNRDAHEQRRVVRFLPLDAPIFQYPNMMDPNHPPVFAAIMRRTSGVKVLECHAFICRRDAASNALVRCCTHAYADFLSAKRMSAEFGTEAGGPVGANNNSDHRANRYQTEQVSRRSEPSSLQRRSVQVGELASSKTGSAAMARVSGKRQEPSRKQAHSLSTGGSNSQEMTHSDENSLDAADSEDNYAIISRQSVAGRLEDAAGGGRLTNRARRLESRDSSGRQRAPRNAKGSSKSLFRGFMPNEQQLVAPKMVQNEPGHESSGSSSRRATSKTRRLASFEATDMRAGDRLSQSLDFLQAPNMSNWYPAPGDTSLWPDGAAAQARDSVKYSIVANKQRRHSKSMQQLVQVPSAMAEVTSGEPEAGARISFAWTRAASCQDIARGSLSRSSSISSQRRRRGRSRRRQSGSRRSSVGSNHNQNSSVGSQTRLNKSMADDQQRHYQQQQQQQQQQNRRSQARNRQIDSSACIYATCSSAGESPLPAPLPPPPPLAQSSEMPAGQVRILRADCCSNQVASSASSSGSTRAKKSSRRHREHQQQPGGALDQAFVEPIGGYYHFMRQPAPPLPPLPPAPLEHQHRASYYNPAGLLYCSPSTPFYGAPPQMGVPPPQTTAAYYPYQHQQTMAPGHLFAPSADAPLYTGAYLLPNSSKSATLKHPGGSSGKASKEALAATLKRESKLARKSQTLATRFRCLSPPLNFLSGGPDGNGLLPPPPPPLPMQTAAGSAQQRVLSDQQHPERAYEQQQVDSNNNRHSVSSISSSATNNSCQVSPGHIVSGKPGFMGSSAGNQVAPAVKSGRDRPKMSWIKRLSLTLSSGSATNTKQTARSSASRPEQAAEFYRNIQEVEQLPEPATTASSEPAKQMESPSQRDLSQDQSANLSPPGEHFQADGQQLAECSQANQTPNPGETQLEAGSKPAGKQPDEQANSKRKKGGFFSGSLTLGRKSRVKSSP